MVGSCGQRCRGWGWGGSRQQPISQHKAKPQTLADSLECVPEEQERPERKEKMKCVFTKQPHPSPSTLSNFQLRFQLEGDARS